MTDARIEIDLESFRHNVRTLSTLVAPARTMLAVKANAYGHGMVPLARAALESGADSLAVLEVPAACELRRNGITSQLFAWLHGPHTDFAEAIDHDVDLGVSALWQLAAITAATHAKPARVHLKIDTGLHRNGARPEDWPGLVSAAVAAQRAGSLTIEGIWSHLADASPEEDAAALARFRRAVDVATSLGCTAPLLHLAASSAGIREPDARLGLVRFGIAAYGISPFDDQTATELGLRQVMAMRAPVVEVETGVARVGVGSGDGIQTAAIGHAHVAIGGSRYPILGIEIDSLTVDVANSAVSVGDEVTIFGPGDRGEATAEHWAVWAGTVGDEIVARASERLPRVYLDASPVTVR
ncbi:MAG: alanine racemase [Acidobacteria bacterium]|nr:alanine racemase [Acidobacteriota bacterium]